jgi:hypothetical protein
MQWEYSCEIPNSLMGYVEWLDSLGRQGWELVTIDAVERHNFKRRKPTTVKLAPEGRESGVQAVDDWQSCTRTSELRKPREEVVEGYNDGST